MERIITKQQIELDTIEDFEDEPQEGELTVIHFITTANTIKYHAGWWVEVIGSIFIRPVGTKDKLELVYAHNIPIAPQKYYFKNRNEQLHFTLFFPALPKDTTHIDVIEVEGGSKKDYFNFYNISLSRINTAPLKH